MMDINVESFVGFLYDNNGEDDLEDLIIKIDETVEDNNFTLKVVNRLIEVLLDNDGVEVDTSQTHFALKLT